MYALVQVMLIVVVLFALPLFCFHLTQGNWLLAVWSFVLLPASLYLLNKSIESEFGSIGKS